MLLHRYSPEDCSSSAKDLLSDDSAALLREMSIDEWLHRLNLIVKRKSFAKHKFHRVEDLKYIEGGEGQIAELELGDKLQARRMWLMMSGDDEAKEHFKYLSKHGVRSICQIFLQKDREIEEIVQAVPESILTGYQLRDIFDSTKKFSEIRTKVYDVILFNKRFHKTIGHTYFNKNAAVDEEYSRLDTPVLGKDWSNS